MNRDVVLGIDLGTSSVRATLVAEDGRPRATAARDYPVESPHAGWSEQRPDLWWRATCEAVRSAHEQVGHPHVCAISFSGQMHGTVLSDAHGEPVRPAIIWSDQRSSHVAAHFRDQFGADRLSQLTANPLATGFQLSTLLWLQENEPHTLGRARYVFLPKDWLRFRMTGIAATDPSDACGTSLFETANRKWSDALIDGIGIDGKLLPTVEDSFAVSGTLLANPAQDMGLREGIPVIVGAGDTPATAFGNAVVEPDTVQCTIGSGGQLVAPIAHPEYDAKLRTHTFCHVPHDRWYAMAAILSAGLSLRWLRNTVFDDASLPYSELSTMAETVPVGAEGLLFLPYLTGERTPHLDANACGVFFGLTPRHTKAHFVRAVMEGVVFALAEGLSILTELGVTPQRIIATGGGAQSELWRRIQANVFGVPVERAQHTEAAAYGAALIAGIGIGWWANRSDVPAHEAAPVQVTMPDERHVAQYQQSFALYRRLYPHLRDIMHDRAALFH